MACSIRGALQERTGGGAERGFALGDNRSEVLLHPARMVAVATAVVHPGRLNAPGIRAISQMDH